MPRPLPRLLIAAGLAALIAGCQQSPQNAASADAASSAAPLPAPLPLATGQPTALAPAPAASALPAAAPVRLGRLSDPHQGYAYLDRAYDEEDAVADAPPDYAFEDNGVRPWTWAAGRGGRVITEPVDGGYRTYYYENGEDAPYLVRDPHYAYAYDDGMLVGVYTLAGALIGYGAGTAYADYGARYYHRGHTLWQGAVSGRHEPVNAHNWADRHDDFAARRAQWQQQRNQNAAWAQWHATHDAEAHSPWQDQRAQHEQAARQFASWQDHRFAGPPPQFDDGPRHHDGLAPAMAGGAALAGAALVGHAARDRHQPAADTPPAGAHPAMRDPNGDRRGPDMHPGAPPHPQGAGHPGPLAPQDHPGANRFAPPPPAALHQPAAAAPGHDAPADGNRFARPAGAAPHQPAPAMIHRESPPGAERFAHPADRAAPAPQMHREPPPMPRPEIRAPEMRAPEMRPGPQPRADMHAPIPRPPMPEMRAPPPHPEAHPPMPRPAEPHHHDTPPHHDEPGHHH